MLSFLCALRRRHPRQTHVFLAGNHDLAMAAFLGVAPNVDGARADKQAAEYVPWRRNEGPLYGAPDAAGMHLQGRRWATRVAWDEHSVFQSEAAFASYGVRYAQRAALLAALPPEHLRFLADMRFVHECALPRGSAGAPLADGSGEVEVAERLIAVHAGLLRDAPLDEQLAALAARDTSQPFVRQLSDRAEVRPPPPELAARRTVLVSGHHAFLEVTPWRVILDSGGGMSDRPITALLFPGRARVASD